MTTCVLCENAPASTEVGVPLCRPCADHLAANPDHPCLAFRLGGRNRPPFLCQRTIGHDGNHYCVSPIDGHEERW